MRKSFLALVVAALLALPAAVAAQGFAVAGRAGTLGLGGEAALGLTDALVIRGGLGLVPIEVDASSFLDIGQDVEATLTLPKTWFNVGVDLYLWNGFRIGGGMLFKPDDFEASGTLKSGTIEIGDEEYDFNEVSKVTAALDAKDQAPYVLIGFGKHTKTGIGLFLDLGVAFLGDPEIVLTAEGSMANSPAVRAELEKERQKIDEDLPPWVGKYWPIINLGIKVGVGG